MRKWGFFSWQLRCWVLSWIYRWWLIYQLNKGVMCHVNNTEVTGLENLISHSTCIKSSWASFSCLEFFFGLRCFGFEVFFQPPASEQTHIRCDLCNAQQHIALLQYLIYLQPLIEKGWIIVFHLKLSSAFKIDSAYIHKGLRKTISIHFHSL